MTEPVRLEGDALRQLRQASEARGFTFYINPPRDLLPEFLGDFRPDAIAKGPGGGIVVQVLRSGAPASKGDLADIAKRISSQSGWEFRAIYARAPADEMAEIPVPTTRQILDALSEGDTLVKAGHDAAALVAAWAVLEALSRLAIVQGEATPPSALSAAQTVQTLAAHGYLEQEDADRLRTLAIPRNAAVHGDLSLSLPSGQVVWIMEQARRIAIDMGALHN
jgi:hypothetical protein